MGFLNKIGNRILLNISPLFSNAGFFLQGQMDIHEKSEWYSKDLVSQTGGFFPAEDNKDRTIVTISSWDNVRRDMLVLLLRSILERRIPGDVAELGVFKGHTAKLIHYYLPERPFYIFDTFEGFDNAEKADDNVQKEYFTNTNMEKVYCYIDPKNDQLKIIKGRFPDSIPEGFETKMFAFVHLDADLYAPTKAGLEYFYEKISPGGIMVIHDYNAWLGARKAVDEFFQGRPEIPVPMPDKSGSAIITKR